MRRGNLLLGATCGALWIVALTLVVVNTLHTRSRFAGTQDSAGPVIVALVLPVVVAAVWLMRHPVVVVVTFAAAAVVSCLGAVSVLHDPSSTAALAIPVPAGYAAFAVAVGFAIQAWLGATRRTS